jgi:hypothetical protein
MTVTSVLTGVGLTGGPITSTGTISLLPPVGGNIGGVKPGANVIIASDGTISVAPPNPGTITGVSVGGGLVGGGTTGTVTVAVNFASPAEVAAGIVNYKAIAPSSLSAKQGSLTESGFVQLSDAYASVDSTRAATPTGVKAVYDIATAALPKSGGTMTGVINFAAGQTFPGTAFPIATPLSLGVIKVGSGLSVNGSGLVTTVNNGTVTAITPGPGLGAPATGNVITNTGTIRLLPPTTDGLTLGGVKAGDNINIANDGTISAEGFLLTNNPYAYNSYIFPPPAVPSAAPGLNGSFLRLKNRVTGEVEWATNNGITSITAGTGLTGGTITSTGTIGLATTTVIPGTYGATGLISTFTVDSLGRVVDAGEANPYAPFQIATQSAPPNLVLDFADNNLNWTWTMLANTVMQAPQNAQSGQRGSILIIQNPTVPKVLTWQANWKWANATPVMITAVASARDMFEFVVIDSTNILITNVIKNYG